MRDDKDRYLRALKEIREVYAGLDGMEPVTCAEAYLMFMLDECYLIAVEALNEDES